MKELLIIRHARSLQNIGETTHLDEGLTDFGKSQADTVGRFIGNGQLDFKSDKFDVSDAVMFVSPFLRTLQTAIQIKHRFPDMKAIIAPEIGEYVNHYMQEEIYVPARDKVFPEFDWSLYKGETYNRVDGDWSAGCMDEWHIDRLRQFHAKLPENKPIIVVSHGLPALTLFHCHFQTKTVPVWDFSISNASLTWVKGDRVIWRSRVLYFETDNIAEFSEKNSK